MTPTTEQIEAWARESGYDVEDYGRGTEIGMPYCIDGDSPDEREFITKFAALAYAAGAAAEREACAKVCDELARGLAMQPGAVFRSADALAYEQGLGAERCSVAIRARKP